MHRHVREHLEEVLADSKPNAHLAECRECNEEVSAMREQSALMRTLRGPEAEPRAGFYARVLERIEAEGAASIWSLFFDSPLGHRLAVASLALAALLCVCLYSSERFFGDSPVVAKDAPTQFVVGEDQPGIVLAGAVDSDADQDSVLVNLVTYREQ